MRDRIAALPALLLLLGCASGDPDPEAKKTGEPKEEHEVDWGYEGDTGPDHWYKLKPEWRIAQRTRLCAALLG